MAATTQIAGADAPEVGQHSGEQRADGEAEVAPEAVDADGAGAPGGVGDVADDGEQCRVDQRGAAPSSDGGGGPDAKVSPRATSGERGGLDRACLR